jgi:hypothetical protein
MSDIRDDLEAAALDLDVDLPDLPASVEAEEEQIPTEEAEPTDVSEFESEAQVDSADDDDDEPQPAAWAAEMRQHWKGLPKDVRKYISERERQQHAYISRFGSEHGNLKKQMGEIESVLKPYEKAISAAGISRGQVIEQLITERSEMMRDPKAFLKRFADANKIDLLDIAVDSDMSEAPEVRRARWEVEDQRRAVESQKRDIEQQQVSMQTEQLRSYIEDWGSKKPHFGAVRQAMAQVLPEIQQSYPYLSFEEQLETTYGAVMRHPNFSRLNKPQGVPQSVKRAASGVSGLSGAPTPTPEAGSIREALMQAAKETGYF